MISAKAFAKKHGFDVHVVQWYMKARRRITKMTLVVRKRMGLDVSPWQPLTLNQIDDIKTASKLNPLSENWMMKQIERYEKMTTADVNKVLNESVDRYINNMIAAILDYVDDDEKKKQATYILSHLNNEQKQIIVSGRGEQGGSKFFEEFYSEKDGQMGHTVNIDGFLDYLQTTFPGVQTGPKKASRKGGGRL